MGTTSIDKTMLSELVESKNPTVERLHEMTAFVRELTFKVKTDWANLPEDEKELLEVWVYGSIPDGDGSSNFWKKMGQFLLFLFGIFFLIRAFIFGSKEAATEYITAQQALTEAILDAIELENEEYRNSVMKALDGERKKAEFPKGGGREWIKSLRS